GWNLSLPDVSHYFCPVEKIISKIGGVTMIFKREFCPETQLILQIIKYCIQINCIGKTIALNKNLMIKSWRFTR
ncbi:MAG TPA: hypothetical protein PKW33_21990, partial [Anaerolineaceae bacterium]|nr:hypothetical protein [Anaerolineaceae bacterium]HPN54280.1 hypothetical protein [Anaerolineaceae bacterium]